MKTDYTLARMLAYVTGLVNQQLLVQNEYLAAENRILRAHLPAQFRLSNPERATLAEIGKRVGRKALPRLPVWPSRTRSSAGTADWLPRSLMDRGAGVILAGRGSAPRPKR